MKKQPLPEDLVPKSFRDQFGSLIKYALGGWDRLRFHASLRPLFSPEWMRTYLCAAKVRLVDFAEHAKGLTHRLLQEAQNVAAAAQPPGPHRHATPQPAPGGPSACQHLRAGAKTPARLAPLAPKRHRYAASG